MLLSSSTSCITAFNSHPRHYIISFARLFQKVHTIVANVIYCESVGNVISRNQLMLSIYLMFIMISKTTYPNTSIDAIITQLVLINKIRHGYFYFSITTFVLSYFLLQNHPTCLISQQCRDSFAERLLGHKVSPKIYILCIVFRRYLLGTGTRVVRILLKYAH